VGDFEKADVLIDGKRIAEVAPTISAGDAEIVDCSGTIVMPGFITTHHHQYETLQRSIIPDGLLAGAWPQQSYGSVVQNIWTAGRIADPANPNRVIWDLGRVPYDPEDCYISELVACLSEISEGITTRTDTSQFSHTPVDHSPARIHQAFDHRVGVFASSGGIDRSSDGVPYEFPGAMNDTAKGIGRIAKTYFSSRDQLVTLGFGGGPGPAVLGADYTGWQLARRRVDSQSQCGWPQGRDRCGRGWA
jgi:cytosine/adenosine deaminase-related metal-dependent hydrolase